MIGNAILFWAFGLDVSVDAYLKSMLEFLSQKRGREDQEPTNQPRQIKTPSLLIRIGVYRARTAYHSNSESVFFPI